MDLLLPRASDFSGPAPFALGCMNFGKRTSRPDSLRIVARALEAGIGVLDTANAYNDGASERLVGEAIRGLANPPLIATKVGFGRVAGKPEGLSPARIHAACDESRARLGVDTIDLYYLHVPDPSTPIEATIDAIGALLAAGRIRRWGVSNYASWQIRDIQALAHAAGLPAPAVAQQLYNALVRQLDVEYFAFAQAHPVHTTIYNPLAGGLLAGGLAFEREAPKGSRFDGNSLYRRRYWRRALFDALGELQAIAADEGLSLLELAYAFVCHHPGVDSVLIGPGSVAHLDAALAARSRELSPEGLRRLQVAHDERVGTDARYAR